MEQYTTPTSIIDSDDSDVLEKAVALVDGCNNDIEQGKCLFYFVRDEIRYNYYAPLFPFQASSTLARGFGFCIQKAILLAALSRVIGIPSRLGFADIINHQLPKKVTEFQGTNLLRYHGFTELFIGHKWVKATPSFDIVTCKQNRIIPVEFDGMSDALLHSHDSRGEQHIEYVSYNGSYEDLPLDLIMDVWRRTYTQEYLDAWEEGFPRLR